MYVKFDIKNEKVEWYQKRLIFAKWAIQNDSDALAATHKKGKNETNSISYNFSSFTLIKLAFSS